MNTPVKRGVATIVIAVTAVAGHRGRSINPVIQQSRRARHCSKFASTIRANFEAADRGAVAKHRPPSCQTRRSRSCPGRCPTGEPIQQQLTDHPSSSSIYCQEGYPSCSEIRAQISPKEHSTICGQDL